MEKVEEMKWNESIRKRSGMYLGKFSIKGYLDTVKHLITYFLEYAGSDSVTLKFSHNLCGVISFHNITKPVEDNIAIFQEGAFDRMDLPIINALSHEMMIAYKSEKPYIQFFEKGEYKFETSDTKLDCNTIVIIYQLDREIWKDQMTWNMPYIHHEISAFSYLHPKVRFHVTDEMEETPLTNTYSSENGLSDILQIVQLNSIGGGEMLESIQGDFGSFSINIALGFRNSDIDHSYIRTYVNYELTPDHGTHLKGLLLGIQKATETHKKSIASSENVTITLDQIQENVWCIIHLKILNAEYAGSVKNELNNEEIIEPIASLVEEECRKFFIKRPQVVNDLIKNI